MKHIILSLALLALLLPLISLTTPRVYVQKLTLENGKTPKITWEKDKSAKEYILRAWLSNKPDDVVSTETDPTHTITMKQVGDGKKFPFTVIATLQLGNFSEQWVAGEVIIMELTHRKTGQKKTWRQSIPEGTMLIKELEKPIEIPPFAKPKKKC